MVVLAAFLLLSCPSRGQDDADIRAIVDGLFNGMRTGDSAAVRDVFLPDAWMQSVVPAEDGTAIHSGSVEEFVAAVGAPHDRIWDERIFDVEIRIDGDMASVWAPYQFYLDSTFSHCGVNQFTLVRQDSTWKVLGIVDTRRKESCP
jgi:hypothetical protein